MPLLRLGSYKPTSFRWWVVDATLVPVHNGRLSASHYANNYTDLLSEYSEAVACFGYVRGRPGIAGNFNTFNQLKAATEKAAEKKLPAPEPDEDINGYYQRVQEIFLKSNLRNRAEINRIDYERFKAEVLKKKEVHRLEKEIADLKNTIRELTKNEEHEIDKCAEAEKDTAVSHEESRDREPG